MGYHIINRDNQIIGWTASWFEPVTGTRLVDDSEPINTDPVKTLEALKSAKIAKIKTQASKMMDETAWRLERAYEREKLGITEQGDFETPTAVLSAREAIRRASNRVESEIGQLDNADAIANYQFTVQDNDYPVACGLTHLQFLRRFSAEERTKITQARNTHPQLNDYFVMLELARFINPADPDVILGVNQLEMIGVIGKGRAGQILNSTEIV